MTDSATDILQKVRETPVEPGDHDKMSHYAPKHLIMESMLEAKPIRALCGKVWVVTRDGEKFPVCPECKDAFEKLELD